ncbi:MAG: LacI family transcriptional regulator [Treponema sp.]|jgi:DNA-binding LacI/PurR family transcriptional regulator|nr:LacI family transcriptional regulator [Treponema sp.]
MATIKDVAARAGVSVSTVSYALNSTRPVSEEKRAVIEEAMRELQYRPNMIARSLASKRTRIIAIFFPYVDHGIGPSEIDLIMEAAKSALRREYQLVIWALQTNTEEELLGLVSQELADGVILMEVHLHDRRIPALKQRGVPFILVGRDRDKPEETFIDIDFFTTMMDCISYLRGLGHRNLVFINQSKKSLDAGYGPVVRTHQAFAYFCKNFGVEGQEVFCESDSAQVAMTVEGLLAGRRADAPEVPNSTAFISMNDKSLPGLIRGIENSGFRIPRDISIVSIVSSGGSVSCYLPGITAFEMDIHALMDAAAAQLIAKLNGRYAEITERLIPCILRERQSSGTAPQGKIIQGQGEVL